MDSEVRQIQLKCLEILQVVDDICRRNEIEYSLCGGSVVGAHLYKGFLPWDDDVDLMMTRQNYNKFLEIAPKELPGHYSVHNYQSNAEFSSLFTKIIDNNTTLVQSDGQISGIFLDITVYDRIPHNSLASIDIFLWKVSQVVSIGKIPGRPFRNLMLNTILKDNRKYFKFFQKVVESIGKTSSRYSYSELFGAYANTVKYLPQIFEHYSEIQFEDKEYMIVRDYIDYLVTRYDRTDFREPKEKQVPSHYKYVNFNLPYKEYIRQKFKNEQ